jgi:hypothetical protein
MKTYLWRLFLRIARLVTLTVDDWIQRQEVLLREPASKAAYQVDVNPSTSAIREKANKKAAPRRRARLKYQHGEFVEVR